MPLYLYIAITLGVVITIYFVVAGFLARLFLTSAELLEDLDWNDED